MILDSYFFGNVFLVIYFVFILMLLNIIKGRCVYDIWNFVYIYDILMSFVEFDENGIVKILIEGDGKYWKLIFVF